MIDTVLLGLILVGVAVNLAATLWAYHQLVRWLDAIGEMVGEALDRQERKETNDERQ